jgi:hypothetical protein
VSKPIPHVTRADLRGFDGESTRLLLWAQDQGARVRVTRRGHAVVYAPDGVRTATVPPNLKSINRGKKNTQADIARLFKKES